MDQRSRNYSDSVICLHLPSIISKHTMNGKRSQLCVRIALLSLKMCNVRTFKLKVVICNVKFSINYCFLFLRERNVNYGIEEVKDSN